MKPFTLFQKFALTFFSVALLGIGYFGLNDLLTIYGNTTIALTLNTEPSLDTGLVGHWTFDGKDMDFASSTAEVLDSSGQGNNGDIMPDVSTGTGADGSVTISSSKNINTDVLGSNRSTNADGIVTTVTANPTGTSISVTSTTGIAGGDEILLINLQGASGDTADVGNYEFLTVDSVSGGTTINVTTSIQNSYDGTTFSNQKVIVQRVPQWTNVTISSGGTLTANDWAGSSGGVLVFRATGTVTVESGGAISANALGYRGGPQSAGTTAGVWHFLGESRRAVTTRPAPAAPRTTAAEVLEDKQETMMPVRQ